PRLHLSCEPTRPSLDLREVLRIQPDGVGVGNDAGADRWTLVIKHRALQLLADLGGLDLLAEQRAGGSFQQPFKRLFEAVEKAHGWKSPTERGAQLPRVYGFSHDRLNEAGCAGTFTAVPVAGGRFRPCLPEYSSMRDTWIGPSVLSADFLRLGEQLAELEAGGADYIHFDVMDGRFVPNISIGLPVLEATKSGTSLPVDVHLMIVEPDRWVEEFADHGADRITF